MMATGRTEAGIILGTAAYMSPEQARGRPVDKRADIWAFGCVLYEMLTGRQAFSGESTTDVLASVVQREPDWSLLPANLPAGVHALLRRALQKNARERLRDIGDARLELAATATSESGISAPPPRPRQPSPPSGRDRALAGIVLACLATGALGAAAAWQWRPASVPAETAAPAIPIRSSITLPPSMSVSLGRGSSVALSPDGRQLVYLGNVDGTIRLYLRPLDRFESIPLAGTEGACQSVFLARWRWIGFFAESKLKKVSLDGGAPVALADVRIPRGEAWLPDGSILVTPMNNVGLSQVPALGGPRAAVFGARDR